jgi:drug/metabolite transporter (DMT)-like permease
MMWDGKVNVGHNWPVLVLLALFNVVLFIGYQTLAGLTATLIYLTPILVGFLAWLMLGEALSPAKLVGLFLGFSEIVAVSLGSFFGTIQPLGVAFEMATAFF